MLDPVPPSASLTSTPPRVRIRDRDVIRQIPYKIGEPREGDLGCVYADPTLAREELGWKAENGLEVSPRLSLPSSRILPSLESVWTWGTMGG